MSDACKPIGFFDSGIGGISVLKEALVQLPLEAFIYYGDHANAPYGDWDESRIREFALLAADFLYKKDIKALVVACNTATSAAITTLRECYSIPVIGMEPALKPAVVTEKEKTILVLATTATLRQNKFKDMLDKYQQGYPIVPLACSGLTELIESQADDAKIHEYLISHISPQLRMNTGVVVLGCTHYALIKEQIAQFFGNGVSTIDGNEGTIRRLKSVLTEENLLCKEEAPNPRVQFFTSGEKGKILPIYQSLIG